MAIKWVRDQFVQGKRGASEQLPHSDVLEVTDARCTLAGRLILDGVNLKLPEGELLVLLGPNGAGKTTLMRACAGRARLTGGVIRVAGRNPFKDKVARRALGIVPQTIALYPHLTARENLSVFGRLLGLRATAQDKAVEVEQFHIERDSVPA